METELTASSIVDEDADVENLTESERNITKADGAVSVVKEYELMIKIWNMDIKKSRKDKEYYSKNSKHLTNSWERWKAKQVYRDFKMKLLKSILATFIRGYPKNISEVKKSSMTLNFFKDFLKSMKEICKEGG